MTPTVQSHSTRSNIVNYVHYQSYLLCEMIPLIWDFDQLLTPLNPKEHTVSWSQDILYPFHNNPSPHFSFVQKYFTLPIALLTQKCKKHRSEMSVMQVTWHPSESSYRWDIYLLTKFQSLRPFIDSPVTHSGVQRSLPGFLRTLWKNHPWNTANTTSSPYLSQ